MRQPTEGQVTVGQLIEILKTLPPDALVDSEGCDCNGPCCGASLSNGKVLVERIPYDYTP